MANKRFNATVTIGGAVTASLRSSLAEARSRVTSVGTALRDMERNQRNLGNSIDVFRRQGKEVESLRQRYVQLGEQIKRTRREKDLLERKQAAAAGMKSAGVALGVAGAVASVGLAPVVQAAQFEKAMLGVAKQVDGARDASGNLTGVYFDMAKQIQLLGREIPLTTNEIAEMVAAGARMGVARDELIDFTRTAATMASAFELPAGELAEQMGKIATLFKIPIPAIGGLADTINYLDDNAISKGGDIIEVLKRIGGTAQMVKMPAKEAAALASTFLTLGASAEVAGTAANAVMRELSIATMQPKRFKAGLAAIKMDAKKVQADMAKDATGTIKKVLDAINKIPQAQRLTVATQLFGKEYGDDVSKLAEGIKEYNRQLDLATSNKAVGSMAREARAQAALTTSQWQLMKNKAEELGVNIGSVLLPPVNSLLDVLGPIASTTAEFVRENKQLVGDIATVAGVMVGSVAGWKAVTLGATAAVWAFNALKLAVMTNPVGALATTLITAGVLIHKNWEPLKEFFKDLWASITKSFDDFWLGLKNKWAKAGQAWRETKAFFGFGDAKMVAQIGANPGAPAAPAIPPMASARGAGATVNDNSQTTIHVQQQPGQDAKQLANEIMRQMEQRKGVQRRSMMFDTVTP